MSIYILFLFILFGVALLALGAELFVKGATGLSLKMRLPEFVIGLTLGALGTSLPELMVSWTSAAEGITDIAYGNVVGSNVTNIALAIGLGALILPVPTQSPVRDLGMFVLSAILLLIFSIGGTISRLEGAFFLVIFIGYWGYIYYRGRDAEDNSSAVEESRSSIFYNLAVFSSGLIMLLAGSKLIVSNAVALADFLGISQTVIGITVVAVGTSLPEITVVLAGAIKKKTGISAGTIIGSNILNILLIGGGTAVISPVMLDPAASFYQAPAVLIITLLFTLMVAVRKNISRADGIILVLIYVLYIYKVVLTGSI